MVSCSRFGFVTLNSLFVVRISPDPRHFWFSVFVVLFSFLEDLHDHDIRVAQLASLGGIALAAYSLVISFALPSYVAYALIVVGCLEITAAVLGFVGARTIDGCATCILGFVSAHDSFCLTVTLSARFLNCYLSVFCVSTFASGGRDRSRKHDLCHSSQPWGDVEGLLGIAVEQQAGRTDLH
jgi:hypothetical protein